MKEAVLDVPPLDGDPRHAGPGDGADRREVRAVGVDEKACRHGPAALPPPWSRAPACGHGAGMR